MRVYQPTPFKEFEDTQSTRSVQDCEGRYQAIKQNYGDVTGKTLIDLCCANGYFGFRFLQDGGWSVTGIENDKETVEFINNLASSKSLNFVCKDRVHPDDKADIGIYLDTHFHEGTDGYAEFMKSAVKVLYTSSSRENDRYRELLKTLFDNVEQIYDENYHGRVIYRCS